MTEELKDFIEKTYGISLENIERLDVKSVNKTWIANGTDGKKYFLKATGFISDTQEDHIQAQVDIAEHINTKGLPSLVPYKTLTGKHFIKKGKDTFLLYDYIDIDKAEITSEKLATAARYLAKFHEATKDLETEGIYRTGPLHEQIDDITKLSEYSFDFSSAPLIDMARKKKDGFSKRFLKDSELIFRAIIKVIHHLWNENYSTKTILHYDYSPENVFFKDGQLIAISDFDFSHEGYIETDVAKAARFWSQENKGKKMNLQKFKSFVKIYEKMNPLNKSWEFYRVTTIYLVLRRLLYAAEYILKEKSDLTFLYDQDIETIKYLMANNF